MKVEANRAALDQLPAEVRPPGAGGRCPWRSSPASPGSTAADEPDEVQQAEFADLGKTINGPICSRFEALMERIFMCGYRRKWSRNSARGGRRTWHPIRSHADRLAAQSPAAIRPLTC